MSWDVILINSSQEIKTLEELDDNKFETTDFCLIFENHFKHIVKDESFIKARGKDFIISYFETEENVSVKMVSLIGENGLFELILLARKNNWQIFDTTLGQMIDLENPSKNGFKRFQKYLKYILKGKVLQG